MTAFDLSGNIMIDIVLENTDNPDLDEMTNNEINDLMNILVQADLKNGVTVNENKIYCNENMTFIELMRLFQNTEG